MATMQDPITKNVSDFLGMTPEQADAQPVKAARKAAAVLRANGYTRKYCHSAWSRGQRWYYKDSNVPESDLCSTTLLGIALVECRIGR